MMQAPDVIVKQRRNNISRFPSKKEQTLKLFDEPKPLNTQIGGTAHEKKKQVRKTNSFFHTFSIRYDLDIELC